MATAGSPEDGGVDIGLPFYDIVLVGEEGVGKTSIYRRLELNTFSDGTISTLGVDNFVREHTLEDGEKVNVRLWDTAGAERYRAMTRSYYKNAKAVVFVYSLDKSSSLTCLTFWIEDATSYAPKNALWVFICNKVDLPMEDQVVYDGEIEGFFDNQLEGIKRDTGRAPPLRLRTSAKTGEGVTDALKKVLQSVAQSSKESSTSAKVPRPAENLLEPSLRLDTQPRTHDQEPIKTTNAGLGCGAC